MSSNSLNTFMMMFENFIQELCDTFPNEPKLKVHREKFEMLKKSNPRKMFELYMNTVEPFKTYIMNRDETLFTSVLDSGQYILSDMKDLWLEENTSENTKNAIWSHLNTMYMFGTTINAIPDNLMQSIESLAQQYASEMDGNEQSMEQFDPSVMLQNMQHMMQTMAPKNNKLQ